MKLKRFLREASDKEELVSFQNHSIIMKYYKTLEGCKIIIDTTNDYCYDKRGWSKIKFRQHYESEKFIIFMQIVDQINKYLNVNFSIFPDNLKIEDFKLSSLTLFTDYKHPVEAFGFKANQPHFPFTSNVELLDSNIYFFDEFITRIRLIFSFMTVKDFLDLVKIRSNRPCDFIRILENDYSHLESKLGDLVNLCLPIKSYTTPFCRHFMPLLQQCLELIKFLPLEYIKIY